MSADVDASPSRAWSHAAAFAALPLLVFPNRSELFTESLQKKSTEVFEQAELLGTVGGGTRWAAVLVGGKGQGRAAGGTPARSGCELQRCQLWSLISWGTSV